MDSKDQNVEQRLWEQQSGSLASIQLKLYNDSFKRHIQPHSVSILGYEADNHSNVERECISDNNYVSCSSRSVSQDQDQIQDQKFSLSSSPSCSPELEQNLTPFLDKEYGSHDSDDLGLSQDFINELQLEEYNFPYDQKEKRPITTLAQKPNRSEQSVSQSKDAMQVDEVVPISLEKKSIPMILALEDKLNQAENDQSEGEDVDFRDSQEREDILSGSNQALFAKTLKDEFNLLQEDQDLEDLKFGNGTNRENLDYQFNAKQLSTSDIKHQLAQPLLEEIETSNGERVKVYSNSDPQVFNTFQGKLAAPQSTKSDPPMQIDSLGMAQTSTQNSHFVLRPQSQDEKLFPQNRDQHFPRNLGRSETNPFGQLYEDTNMHSSSNQLYQQEFNRAQLTDTQTLQSQQIGSDVRHRSDFLQLGHQQNVTQSGTFQNENLQGTTRVCQTPDSSNLNNDLMYRQAGFQQAQQQYQGQVTPQVQGGPFYNASYGQYQPPNYSYPPYYSHGQPYFVRTIRQRPNLIQRHPFCTRCGAVNSPAWRKGPAGPKTLCNACGVKYMKEFTKRDNAQRRKDTLIQTF